MSDATTTATKKFSLPAKHYKFIQYGYFLINHLACNDTSIDTQKLLQTIHTFDEPIAQHAFVESFFSQSDDIAATIKNTIKTNRAALKQQANASDAKPRSKAKASKQKPAVQDDLVAELVALAKSTNISDTSISQTIEHDTNQPDTPKTIEPTATEPNTKEPKTREPKTKEPKTKEPKTKEPKTKEPKTKEPKTPKTTKTKQNTKPDDVSLHANINNSIEEPSQTSTDDIELPVSIFKFNDKNYLIDDQNNVYDFHTHDAIGVFDKNKNSINAL